MKRTNIIVNIVSYLYALLFLYTGISKLIDQDIFKQALYKSPIFDKFTPILAIGIPVLELMIALVILTPFFRPSPWCRKWGLIAGTVLMALFTLYVGYMVKFKNGQLPCSCGGIIQKLNWHQHFYFNSLFTLAGIISIWLNSRNQKSGEAKLSFT